MDIKEIQNQKILSVTIYYDPKTDEWITIRVEFLNGYGVDITREQIEAYLRLSKTVEDLHEVANLHNNLIDLFGSRPVTPSRPPIEIKRDVG